MINNAKNATINRPNQDTFLGVVGVASGAGIGEAGTSGAGTDETGTAFSVSGGFSGSDRLSKARLNSSAD